MKMCLVIIECAGYIFWQLFLRRRYLHYIFIYYIEYFKCYPNKDYQKNAIISCFIEAFMLPKMYVLHWKRNRIQLIGVMHKRCPQERGRGVKQNRTPADMGGGGVKQNWTPTFGSNLITA